MPAVAGALYIARLRPAGSGTTAQRFPPLRLDALRSTWTQYLKSIEARVEKDREAHKEQAAWPFKLVNSVNSPIEI